MVSIIVVNFNTFSITKKCIYSIISNTTVEHEIILVDNASTECDCDDFKKEFPKIKLIKSAYNCGFAKANNLGISKAEGDYILLLNSDTVLLNNAIDLSYQRLISDETIGVLACQTTGADGNYQHVIADYNTISGFLAWSFKLHKIFKTLKPRTFDPKEEHEGDWVSGAFFFFPRKVLNSFPDKVFP